MRRETWRVLSAVLAMTVLLDVGCSSEETASVDGFAQWLAEHEDDVGFVAFKVSDPDDAIVVNGDESFPLASTRKVLILNAYAVRVAEGALDPAERVPLAAVERWYWEGTDGGAHPQALDDLSDRIRGDTVALDDVVFAMIRWSDNAAADYVLERVGGPAPVLQLARRSEMRRQDEIMPVLGEFVAWSTSTPADWTRLGVSGRARRGTELAEQTAPADLPELPLPEVAEQREFAASSPGGTPREWARLLRMVHSSGPIPPEALAIVRRHLGWPLQVFASNRERFDRFGAKGGSLPGVLTEAMFIEPKDGGAIAAALFVRAIPADIDDELGESFVHQQFLLRLAEDETFWSETERLLE